MRAVHTIHPLELAFSTLIGAIYETPCDVIAENSARI
jgi:hypothetical protein